MVDAHRALLEETQFLDILRKTGSQVQSDWAEVVRMSQFDRVSADSLTPGKEPRNPIAKVIKKIRNEAAFHYDHKGAGKLFAEGYRLHFGLPTTLEQECAFVSLGDTMEASRFYFADGVMDALLAKRWKLDGKKATDFASRVNLALRYLIEAVLDHFQGLAEPLSPNGLQARLPPRSPTASASRTRPND